jgi:calcium permeable stress-gated cation channel
VRISGLEINFFINSPLAIGLQSGWKSFALFACIPPFILVLLFKAYIERTFARSFKYYVPTESELRDSEKLLQPEESRNRLTDHFGHPALHEALRTPLLYPNMMPLLAEVYSGRLD